MNLPRMLYYLILCTAIWRCLGCYTTSFCVQPYEFASDAILPHSVYSHMKLPRMLYYLILCTATWRCLGCYTTSFCVQPYEFASDAILPHSVYSHMKLLWMLYYLILCTTIWCCLEYHTALYKQNYYHHRLMITRHHGGPLVSRMTLSVPLSVDTGVTLQADPGLAEPCADWALEVRSCRWDRGF